MSEANPFDTHFLEYDAWYDANANVFQSEVEAIRAVLPPAGRWVEVGVGSGRFSVALGIPCGVEPAEGVASLARKRGIEVVQGRAERLPLADASVDAVFAISALCFVEDMNAAFRETVRVLVPGGTAVIAFIPRDSAFGALYTDSSQQDRFFRRARLRTRGQVLASIEAAGLEVERICSTLRGAPAAANNWVQTPDLDGRDGSFVVVRAKRP